MSGNRLVVIKSLDPFSLPETVEVVCERDGVFGQGFFEPHQASYECASGERKSAKPDINISSNRITGQFEIHSITIYTLKIVNNPAKAALPRAGQNVTNDKNLRVRTPSDEPEGKGYWRSVIKEMERYEDQGVNLQWYAPGSTAYHEELHNQQFREGIRKNQKSLVRKIEEAIDKTLANSYKPGIVEVRNAAQDAVQENTRSVLVVTGNDSEPEAYRKTFAALWRPEIDKIGRYAQEHGWS